MCKTQREQREKLCKKSVALENKRRLKSAARQRATNANFVLTKAEVFLQHKNDSRAQSTLNAVSRPGTAGKRETSLNSIGSQQTPSPNQMSRTK